MIDNERTLEGVANLKTLERPDDRLLPQWILILNKLLLEAETEQQSNPLQVARSGVARGEVLKES